MGNIISFFGADGKCGTSQTVLSLAMMLAGERYGYRVLLIHAEEPLGDDYIPEISESMENIKPCLEDRLWDIESICSNASMKRKLGVIGGANRMASGSLYDPEKVMAFILDMASVYDFVLCDCGSDLSHGLSLGAMIASEKRCIVLSQGEKALRRYEWLKPMLSKLDLDGEIFICSRYSYSSPCDRYYIDHRLCLQKGSVIPVSFSEDGGRAEFYRRPLISFRNRKYAADIEGLADKLIDKNGF